MKYLSNIMLKNKLKIFENPVLIDFIKKSVLSLTFIYLSLFALESVLPGIVIEVFNFNLLLFIIVVMMAFVLYIDGVKEDEKQSLKGHKQLILIISLSILFILTMFVVLYKVSLFETVIYLISCLFLINSLQKIFK